MGRRKSRRISGMQLSDSTMHTGCYAHRYSMAHCHPPAPLFPRTALTLRAVLTSMTHCMCGGFPLRLGAGDRAAGEAVEA